MTIKEFELSELIEFFAYLDDLRESGETNMFGAGPYLRREFALIESESETVTLAWMRTFSHDKSPADRAEAALAKAEAA